MRGLKGAVLAFVVTASAGAQSGDALLSDSRLTVHTLLREDIFACLIGNDMTRLAKAERNLEILLQERPGQRANILAWKASALVCRAVIAHEAGRADEFERLYAGSREIFAEASGLPSGNEGVPPIVGGTMSVFADRLPERHRADAWSLAYDNYSILWKHQGAGIEKLPVHLKGEVLAGLAQSAQRTGRADEAAMLVDRMLLVLANTPYEATARQWKTDPASAATTNLTCKNCHSPGRLSARVAALSKGGER